MRDNFNIDEKLKLALESYTESWTEGLPSDDEREETHAFSPDFEKKMNRLVSREKLPYYQCINTLGKRVAVFAVSLIIVLAATVTSVRGLREPVVDFAVKAYETIVTVTFNKCQVPREIEKVSAEPQSFEYYFENGGADQSFPECYDQNANAPGFDRSAPQRSPKSADPKKGAEKDSKTKDDSGVCVDGWDLLEFPDDNGGLAFDLPDMAEDGTVAGQNNPVEESCLTEQGELISSEEPGADELGANEFCADELGSGGLAESNGLSSDDGFCINDGTNSGWLMEPYELIDIGGPLVSEEMTGLPEPTDVDGLIVSEEMIGLPEPSDCGGLIAFDVMIGLPEPSDCGGLIAFDVMIGLPCPD